MIDYKNKSAKEIGKMFHDALFEKNGVLNYYGNIDPNDLFKAEGESLYTYVRGQIINELNKGKDKFNLIIPITYFNNDRFNGIKKVTLFYNLNGVAPKMGVYHTSNDKEIEFIINMNIYDDMFKPTFFHELHHMCQVSNTSQKFSLPDIEKINKIFFSNKLTKADNDLIKKLNIIVYLCNPAEVTAHNEQIYKESYLNFMNHDERYTNGKKICIDQYEKMMQKYFVDSEESFNLLLSLTKNKQSILRQYIWCILCCNHNTIIGVEVSHLYRLFTKEIYQNKDIKNIFEVEIKNISSTEPYKFFSDMYNKYYHLPIFDITMEIFSNRILHYRRKFVDNIKSIVYTAYRDAIDNEKELYKKLHAGLHVEAPVLKDYIIEAHYGKFYTEIVIEDRDDIYITILYGKTLSEIFRKCYILTKYIGEYNGTTLKFGYDYLQKRFISFSKAPVLRKLKVDFVMFPKLKNIRDIDNVIKFININFNLE